MAWGQPYCRNRATWWDWVGIFLHAKRECGCPYGRCFPLKG